MRRHISVGSSGATPRSHSRRGKAAVAGVAALAVVLAPSIFASSAVALDDADPSDPSAAQGQLVSVDVNALNLGLQVAGVGFTQTSFPTPNAAGWDRQQFNIGLLSGLAELDFGSGLSLPLLNDGTNNGLLNLGDLGAGQSVSQSPDLFHSTAGSGIVTDDGLLDVGSQDPTFEPATLNVTDLLGQLGLSAVTDGVIDELALEVGALASNVTSVGGANTPDYQIADLKLNVHSDTVAGLSTSLAGAIQGTTTPVGDLLGNNGALGKLAQSIVGELDGLNVIVASVSASVGNLSINGLDTVGQTVTNQLLLTPVQNTTGSVLVDLSDGTITLDLAKLLVETNTGADLNSLDPNTEVLSAPMIAAIQQGVTSALTGTHPNGLLGKTTTILNSTLNSLAVNLQTNLDLKVAGISVATGNITVAGSVAQFAGTQGPQPTVTPNITLAGLNVSLLTQPVVDLLTSDLATVTGPLVVTALDQVVPTLQPALAGVTGVVLTPLTPALDEVISQAVSVRINEQPTKTTPAGVGDLGAKSFTVRALSATVLPALNNAVKIDLGSSTVRSAAQLIASPDPVLQGATVSFTGTGFDPLETVTITGRDGMTLALPLTADANGEITASWSVPAAFPVGSITFTATGVTSGTTATDSVVVQAPGGGTDVNANASASAAASAQADDDSNASAQVAAQAAAQTDATSTASAAATTQANAAAQAAATATASTDASTDATTTANAAAQASALAAAQADASSSTNADASTAATANTNAAADAAAIATSSTNASATAAANATASASATADADLNASASAAASANADSDANQSAQVAAQAAALANATSTASAAATANANAAAQAAATATASATASTDATSVANASAQVAAQSTSTATSIANANASSATNADASSAARGAADPTSSADASSAFAANATATANATTTATANATTQASAAATPQASAQSSAQASAAASGNGGKLPATGSEAFGTLALGGILLMLGVGVMAARRVRRAVQR